jgi:hypothetical protein
MHGPGLATIGPSKRPTPSARPPKTQNPSKMHQKRKDRPRSLSITPSGSSTDQFQRNPLPEADKHARRRRSPPPLGEEPVVAAPAPSPLHLRPQCNSRGGDGSGRAGAAGPAPPRQRRGRSLARASFSPICNSPLGDSLAETLMLALCFCGRSPRQAEEFAPKIQQVVGW